MNRVSQSQPVLLSNEQPEAVRSGEVAPTRTIPTTCIETIDGDPATALRLSFQIKVF